MTEAIQKTLRDSKAARWGALAIVAFTMFTGYMFTDILSPLKGLAETSEGWTSSDFGFIQSAYGWFNVFFGMLILAGILLDKLGIRFSAIASATIMVIGAGLQYWAVISDFAADYYIFGTHIKVMLAALGYAVFGVGVEYAGITVSKVIVKWFKGKEMALAMGLQVAFARLGSFSALAISPFIADRFNFSTPFLVGVLMLVIGLMSFLMYNAMDTKLDKQIHESNTGGDEDDFKLSDIGMIIGNRGFWYIAILCVLFYSAVFPFYKYGPDLMVNKFGITDKFSGLIPSLVPFGTIMLTPFFGGLYDKKGKGATIMIIGAILLVIVHVILYLPGLNSITIAAVDVIFLGIAFSLVPSAMWPSVPKIIPEKQLGTAFAVIFWIQNWGLMGVPYILGIVLDKTNPVVVETIAKYRQQFLDAGLSKEAVAVKLQELKSTGDIPVYNYETTWLIFIALSAIAVLFAFLLKAEDKKKGYGLELPNIEN
jgi:MFS family permease